MPPGFTWGAADETIVGLDVADDGIAAAQVRVRRDGRIEVQKAGWTDYEPGAGDEDIAAAIRRLWRRRGFVTRTVCSCFRAQSLALKYFRYPGMSEKELASALRLEAEAALHAGQDKIAMDWHINRAPQDEGDVAPPGEMEGVLVAAPQSDVEKHLSLLQKAGLYPAALDAGCMAICNLYLAVKGPARERKTACLVHLSRAGADIAIYADGACLHPRSVFSRSGTWEEAAGYLIETINDVVKYYQFKLRQQPVDQVVLTGRVPTRGPFLDQMRKAVGLTVWIWNPLEDLFVRSARLARYLDEREDIGPLLAISLGLAMRRADP